jgi:hypothetical protein
MQELLTTLDAPVEVGRVILESTGGYERQALFMEMLTAEKN